MDLLLSHGYFLRDDPHEQEVMKPYPPLGLLYISSHLRARGFAVDVFDSTFSDFESFEQHLARTRPPVVGLYANMMTRATVLRMARVVADTGATVVVGGPDPANYAERYLDHGADVVVIGEGEETLEELLPHLVRHGPTGMEDIAGIVYREDSDEIVRTALRPYIEDLSAQPYPDRSQIDIGRYVETWREHHGRGPVSLITARGCPYSCNWCSHAVFGYTHRRRSPSDVANEVEHIIEAYDPDMLWYADDVFTIHFRWFREYAEELRRRGIRIPFETISREDRLNEDIVQALAEMGAYRIWVGAESGSQRILDAMERRTDAERVREVVHLLRSHGIEAGMFIMLGYEGEEVEDIEETVDLLKRCNPDQFLTTVAYPIEGTPYHEKVAHRTVGLKPWREGSDRDRTVLGRYSRRFYRHATRWMVGEVRAHRERTRDDPDYLRIAKAYANARLGRMGMRWTRHEVERGTDAAAVAHPKATGAPAFDRVAAEYDDRFTDTHLGLLLRNAVHRHLADRVHPDSRVLELGCGTGEDAVRLAEKGARVYATDVSEEMLEVAARKARERGMEDRITFRRLDVSTLASGEAADWSPEEPVDLVLANFGVLNCIPDRAPLAEELSRWVRSGGTVALVLMSPTCIWEMGWHLAHGRFRAAFRRRHAGALAHVGGGKTVRVWYPSVSRLTREMGPSMIHTGTVGIGSLLPPTELSRLVERRPRWFERVARWDAWAGRFWPLDRLGDHYLAIYERR